jgi:hypothetical protein
MVFQPIPADELAVLEPPTQAERHKRAMYLAAQLGRHSIQLIRKCLNHCDEIDFSGGGAMKARDPLDNDTHYTAMKELATLSIWLALEEQLNGTMPDWLKTFFCDSWACADILFDHPTSKEVLDCYPPMERNVTCQTAAMRMCHNLHLGDVVQDALVYISDTLVNAADTRAEILEDALKRPIPELHQLMNQPAPV